MTYSTAEWFFSVVVVGLLVNIASAYLLPLIDKQLEKYSEMRRNQNAKKKAYIESEIEKILAEPSYLVWLTARYNNSSIKAQAGFIILMVFLGESLVLEYSSVVPSILIYGVNLLGIILLITTLGWMNREHQTKNIINTYFKLQNIKPPTYKI